VQLQKLKEAGYVEIEKKFKDNYPQTLCKITKEGIKAFDKYVKEIQQYINIKKINKMETSEKMQDELLWAIAKKTRII
jgi:DNA-binding PadR family transcriptional regulator